MLSKLFADSKMGITPIFLFYDAISIIKCQFLDFLCTMLIESETPLLMMLLNGHDLV